METKKKPPCKYGLKCFRKNPKHFEDFSHPSELDSEVNDTQKKALTQIRGQKVENSFKNFLKGQNKMKQTTLQFGRSKNQMEVTEKEVSKKLVNAKKNTQSQKKVKDKNTFFIDSLQKKKENTFKNANNSELGNFNINKKRNIPEDQESHAFPKKPRNSKLSLDEDISHSTGDIKSQEEEDEEENDASDKSSNSEKVESSSWTYIKNDFKKTKTNKQELDLKNKSISEIIKTLFLVEMPPCFYSFFKFCKSLNEKNPEISLEVCGLHLVGPFDVLLGKMDLTVEKELALCHWRFFYDPPEFQTVLASSTEFHIGYWRDSPHELPVFLASNDSAKDCTIKMEAENIFGTVFYHCDNFIKSCDPFLKVKVCQLQKALSDWAEKHGFTLEKKTSKMIERQKKIVTKSFHKLGLVVPVEKKTEVGYRPLIESEKNIKKICTLIINADDDNEKECLWEKLQPLITAANIANDECDFGNGLELGINLFCMGSPVFHETVEHLLTVAYSLLNRHQFEIIIKAHLKRRRKALTFICSGFIFFILIDD